MTWAWIETSSARDRLVADDEPGVERDGPRDPYPLALAAGELVRVAVVVLGGEPHHLEQLLHPPLAVSLYLVGLQRLADDAADGHAGVQRGVRVLEDYLHVAPHGEHPLSVVAEDVLALEEYLALGGLQQPQHEPRQRALAATRLPNEAKGLAAPDGQVHAVDGLHVPDGAPQDAGLYREVHLEVPRLEEVLSRAVRAAVRAPVFAFAAALALAHALSSTPSSSSTGAWTLRSPRPTGCRRLRAPASSPRGSGRPAGTRPWRTGSEG